MKKENMIDIKIDKNRIYKAIPKIIDEVLNETSKIEMKKIENEENIIIRLDKYMIYKKVSSIFDEIISNQSNNKK